MLASLATGPLCALLFVLQGPKLEGVVRAPSGAAAGGARVVLSFLAEHPLDPARVVDQTVADAQGRFALAISGEWMARRGWKSLDLWAWDEHSGLCALSLDVEEAPIGQQLVLELPAASGQALAFLDPEGRAVAGADVRMLLFEGHPLPELVAEAFRAPTDAQGVAHVRFDRAHASVLGIDAEGFGSQRFVAPFPQKGWSTDQPFRLFPAGQVRIEVEGTPPAGVGSARLRLSTYNRVDPKDQRSAQVGGEWTLSLADAHGSTQPLVWGYTNFDLRFDATPPALPRLFPAKVQPGESATVRLVWAENAAVSGRVEDADGKPVAGVVVRVFAYPARFPVVSDADGRIAFLTNPGALAIEGAEAPGWFTGINRFVPPRYEIAEETARFELPTLRLVRCRVSGRVVDSAGRPMAGAWVHGMQKIQWGGRFSSNPCCALADADGRFALDGLDPETTLELAARLGEAMAEGVQVPANASEPIEIVLGAAQRIPITATLRDRAGNPVPNATVVFWRESPPNLIGGEREERLAGGATEARSDAQGKLNCGPSLAPATRYTALVRAEGCAPFQSAWFAAEDAGQGLTFELEPLATVAGRLLDRDGQPIAGARVFVRDAPRALETRTDAQGRFALAGAFARGFLLAETQGHGFLGRRYDGPAELEWRLGVPEPTAARPVEAATPRARELELARSLLAASVAAARAAGDESALYRALERQAWVDPAGVLAALEKEPLETSWLNEAVRGAVVDVLQANDPDEALAVADSLEDPWDQALAKLGVVDALGADQCARKLELLGTIRAGARQVEHPPYRLVVLAHVAERLLDLGERDTARTLLAEGLELARTLPAEDWSGYARCSFAEELAQVELEPALELVATMGDEDRGRHLGNIAHELAALDPAAAERLLGQFPPGGHWSARQWAPRVCYRMARADLERARGIAPRYECTGQCLGAMALALADLDPETARGLLREAFDALASRPQIYSRAAFVGASLLPLAQRLAPREYEEFVARALALREPRADLDRPGALARHFWEDAALAFAIALEDRALARSLLEPAVQHVLTNGALGRESDWRGVYAALAEIDPERAAQLCEHGLPAEARAAIGSVLARTGAERLRFVQDEYWNLWTADKEDL